MRRQRDDDQRIIYVERESSSSVKALLLGALIGAGLALLYAPQTGEDTRRGIKRRLRKVRAVAEEKIDELSQRLSRGNGSLPEEDLEGDELEALAEADAVPAGSAREELERRLEQARARRRGPMAEESGA